MWWCCCSIEHTLCRHEAFYAFHQINAYEEGDSLMCDVAMYPDHRIMVQLHRTNMLFGLDPLAAAVPHRCACQCCHHSWQLAL